MKGVKLLDTVTCISDYDMCPYCCIYFDEGEKAVIADCGHMFHQNCIEVKPDYTCEECYESVLEGITCV